MKDLGLDFDRAFDRIRNEAVLFCFFQDARNAGKIIDRGDHKPRLYDNFADLITLPFDFFELTLGAARETHQWNLRELRDREQRQRITGIECSHE